MTEWCTGTVTINVRDVDDNPPVFSRNNLTVTVDENAAQGVPINMPQILVSDADQVPTSFELETFWTLEFRCYMCICEALCHASVSFFASVFLSLCVHASVSVSVFLSLSLYLCLFACLCHYLSICLSVCLSLPPSLSLSLSLSLSRSLAHSLSHTLSDIKRRGVTFDDYIKE